MLRTLLNRLPFHKRSFTERHVTALLIASAIVAMLLSLAIGLRQSVWFDEAYSIMLAKQSVGHLIQLTAIDTHPPLYYLLLKAWASLFGWGELALRSLSVLALGGAVLIGALLIRRLFGARAALIASLVMVVSPFLLRYGFEIRMYALGGLIGIGATYVLVVAQAAIGRRRLWLYGAYAVLVALGMYTLYYTALLWLAHVVWLVWLSLRRKTTVRQFFLQPWWLAFIGAAVLFTPWLPTFLGQVSNGALAPIAQAMTLENLIGIVSFYTVYQPVWQLSPITSLLVLFVLLMFGWLSVRAFKLAPVAGRPYLVLLALYLLVPVAILTLIGFSRPMYVERYLAHVAIGFSLFVAVAISLVYSKALPVQRWLIGLVGVVMLVGVAQLATSGNFNFQRLQKPEIARAAAQIDCTNDATVLAADPYVAIELDYYLPNCPVKFYSDADELRGGYAPLNHSRRQVKSTDDLSASGPLYYVYYDKPQLNMPDTHMLVQHTTFGPLTVDELSVAPRD